LADLAAGETSASALLVAAAGARLRRLGLSVPAIVDEPELRLYRLLSRQAPEDAFNRYNSLMRRIDSFASALERELGQSLRAARERV
jgi:hypothetical protein